MSTALTEPLTASIAPSMSWCAQYRCLNVPRYHCCFVECQILGYLQGYGDFSSCQNMWHLVFQQLVKFSSVLFDPMNS